MSDTRHLLLAVTLCGVTTLTACGSSEPATSNGQADDEGLGSIAGIMGEALDDAEKLRKATSISTLKAMPRRAPRSRRTATS